MKGKEREITMDGTDLFLKRFNIPKPQLNKNKAGVVPSPTAFKDYEELCKTFLIWFEEFSGRRVNVEQSVENLVYFFDQGFEMDDMINYVRHRQKAEFFLTNPDVFTIRNLFPIKDADKANATWDSLAYQQSIRTKTEKIIPIHNLLMKCGHRSDHSYSCLECIKNGDEFEIMKDPYSPAVPENKTYLSDHFKREGDESFFRYAQRTFDERKRIHKEKGIKLTDSHFQMVQKFA